jgi:demethylmenaquinone methyltransferase/2-methoxy-6-polyprenyl-1,4-benzoquinol methylase
MRVTPYTDSEETKKKQVEQMFDSISGNYDFLNRSLSFGIDVYWRKKLVNQLGGNKPKHMIDIATGTADVALSLLKLKPESIIGIDISEGMLGVGRKKILKRGAEKTIQLERGDSEKLRFVDNRFDAATVAFGVRNFENLEQGLSEINRVLKPGGKLVILEFSRPKNFPIRQLYDFYFRYFCPWWGKLVSKDASAYRYLYDSVSVFPDGTDFLEIAGRCGFKDLKAERVTFGIVSLYTGVK